MLVYFIAIWIIWRSFGTAIWIILRPFELYYGHLDYITAIWYILWPFGIFCGQLVYTNFAVLACCSKQNLATLVYINDERSEITLWQKQTGLQFATFLSFMKRRKSCFSEKIGQSRTDSMKLFVFSEIFIYRKIYVPYITVYYFCL
jgi:hypothetical protein